MKEWRSDHSCPARDFLMLARCTSQTAGRSGLPTHRPLSVSRRFHPKITRQLAAPQHVPDASVGAICEGAMSPYVTLGLARAG